MVTSGGVGDGWLRRHRLAGFFGLTFALSWGVPLVALAAAPLVGRSATVSGYSPLAYLAVWAPAIAAFVVVGRVDGRAGLRAYVRHITAFRGRARWYGAVLLGVPAAYLLSAVVASTTGGPPLALESGWFGAFLAVSLRRLTQGPVEEIGWRGFALPLLQRRYSGLVSAVLLGTVWALWHAPALVISTAEFARAGPLVPGLVRLFVTLVATSIVVTVVYNGSGGSVPLAVGFHWLTNLTYPWETTATVPLTQDVVFVCVSALVAVTVGRRYLGRAHLATTVYGTDE
ncbi:type II CAAX endopeptidase family protein [Salinigranum halophilum]|uniref:type II CAAX endopeptidase family protein n=1 Tax=Salinigranum halophilum TaxID=2565931 RepID=UPI0010A86BB0|nr:type II CAAX endopeptidase family protein [Salinigranum halophilum]